LCGLHAFAIIGGVERQRLRSRAVVSAGYDEQALELELEFRSGHVYRYEGVPPSVYAWLLRIENKGGFVRRMIQGRYVERSVPRPPPGELPAAGPPPPDALEDALRASLERLGKPAS
jgi:hypothetical protein